MIILKRSSLTIMNKMKKSLSGFLIIGLVAFWGVKLEAQCLFLNNPSFENTPLNWQTFGGAVNTITTGAQAGTRFLRINNTTATTGVFQDMSGQTNGTPYMISVYTKTSGNPNALYLSTEFFDASWNWLGNNSVSFAQSATWTEQKLLSIPPAGTFYYRVTVQRVGNVGVLDIDNFCVTVAPPACGLTINATNATHPLVPDGQITLSNIVANRYILNIGQLGGTTMSYGNFEPVVASQPIYAKGLLPGSYQMDITLINAAGSAFCDMQQTITVGSNSLPTCATTAIGGYVYGDHNQSGLREKQEIGYSGVTVSAYNAAGTLAASANTNSVGRYDLTGLTAGTAYRLEYTWGDNHLQPGAIGTSGSSIQFVNSGTCNVNMGLNYPPDYCHTKNPWVASTCFINGDPLSPAVAPIDAMVHYPFNAYSTGEVPTQTPPVSHTATTGQIGATWGLAYQKSTGYLYASAMMRRFMGFGPLGTGGIYKVNMNNPAAPVVSNWINLNSIGIPTGADTRNGTPANSLSSTPGAPTWDTEAFNAVGKVGIGGLDFSDFGDTLWLVNLNDRKLYGIKNVSPTTTPTSAQVLGGWSITPPTGYSCSSGNGDFRPWAVKYYKGKVYVGCVCSGESTPFTNANLTGMVISFDPANAAAGFSHVFSFSLNYSRTLYNLGTGNWMTWINYQTTGTYQLQPVLSAIEFDINGEMILGIGDRGGFQTGYLNYPPSAAASNFTQLSGNSYGDILKACKSGTGYVMYGQAGCPLPGTSPPQNPGATQEFYWGEHGPESGVFVNFSEQISGSLVNLPINNTLVAASSDPSAWHAGGAIWLNNVVGNDDHRYTIYDINSPGGNGKASGLGGIEALCQVAPIEIGERIWADTDHDGLQDAGESGISGVTVQLYRTSDNVLIGTTTTNSAGVYKFTGLQVNTGYYISVSKTQTALSAYNALAIADAGTNDRIDNDATTVGTNAIINLTTGWPGFNNHTYDMGFRSCIPMTVSVPSSTICTGGTGTLAATATGGTAPFTYNWSAGLGAGASKSVTPASTASYTVTVTDAQNCPATTSATVTVVADPLVAITGQSTACVGGSITLTASITGGIGSNNILWQRRVSPSGSWSNVGSNAITYATDGTLATGGYDYQIILTQTGSGCGATALPVTANVIADPVVNVSTGNATLCVGGSTVLTGVGSGGTGTCAYQWQQSTDGTTGWTDVAGATSATFTTPALSSPLYYRVVYTCTGAGCCN
jgi:SdrD B-like domain